MSTLTSDQCQKQSVIAELNLKLANKAVRNLYIFNGGFLMVSLQPYQNSTLEFEIYSTFLSIQSFNPYLHVMIPFTNFSHIEITDD